MAREDARPAILVTVNPCLFIRVLGPLEVERVGAVLPIGSPMQRRLLTVLTVARGETVSTDRLVDALWGAQPPESARNGLQTYVARLRRTIGEASLIVTTPTGYALDASCVEVDAWTFRDLVHSIRRSVDADPAAAAAALSEGLAAWRGEAYAEFADDVAREAAVQMGELRIEAVELLARSHLLADAPVDALAALDGLSPSATFRESTVLLEARALGMAGRLPDALEALRALRARLADELGLDPSAAVGDLEHRLLRGEYTPRLDAALAAQEPASAPIAPPRTATQTVGREEDLGRIMAAFEAAPLVTLVGPGGVGKTRLAAVVGNTCERGAWIDLAPVRHADDVAPTFAEGLGIAVPAGTAVVRAVAEALSGFTGTVIIDNCEHVLDPVVELVDAALSRPHQVRILATSRERLDVAGELVIAIAPLRAPQPEEATPDDPAVQLFLDRLVAAGGSRVQPKAVAEVVAAVDGLPLAIELAAAQAVSLPIEDLVARLRQRIDVLAGTRRRHGERHRTLNQVIGWSYDLLRPPCRALFLRLSVFSATFSLEDAEQVCGYGELPQQEVATALARLVDASMVTRLDRGRFRLLEPVRLYAAARLGPSGDAATTYERQRLAALELTARADAAVSGSDETDIVIEVERALPDLRAVHARALADGDLTTVARMTAQLFRFAYLQARADVLLWGTAVAEVAGPAGAEGDRARALAAAATGSWLTGDIARGLALSTAAGQLATDSWSKIAVTEVAGDVHLAAGDLAGSVAAYTQTHACAAEFGHAGLTANAEVGLAFALFQQGDRRRAAALARSGLRRAIECGAPSVHALAEYTLGEVLADEDPDAALAAFARARSLAVAGRARFQEGLARTAEVAIRGRHGPPNEALRRYGEALELWRDTGADGLLLTALRNLIVLLVRSGADQPALEIHAVTERLATKPSYGQEAARLGSAVAAARERLGSDASAEATSATTHVRDLRAAADLALATIAATQDASLDRGRK